MLNTGQLLNERYQIIKVIGRGGMSTVYQAKDLSTGRLLAVKDVARAGKESDQAVEQSLVTEGNMLKQLSNNHLPRIYDIIENYDSFMLVMDFIEGESLDKVITREGAQPMDRVLDWGMQICEVFDYLHNQPVPIIYRDMKPANVILQPNGQLMMIDFGTARTQKLGVAMAADTLCLGTAGFAAPEQFGGIGQSTPKTDIFCLGATLYNMITGHSPCDRPQGILPLENWNPALKDTPLSYIIYKCTRNDPDARYASARELYEDLSKARQGQFGGFGNSGKLGGREWQKQKVKGSNTGNLAGGLSGLLNFGKTAQDKSHAIQQEPAGHQPVTGPANTGYGAANTVHNGWQTGAAVVATDHYRQDPYQQNPYQQNPYQQDPYYGHNGAAVQNTQSPWKKIMIIGLAIAVVMILLGFVLLLMDQMLAGLVFMIIALGAAALAVMGVVMARRTEG